MRRSVVSIVQRLHVLQVLLLLLLLLLIRMLVLQLQLLLDLSFELVDLGQDVLAIGNLTSGQHKGAGKE